MPGIVCSLGKDPKQKFGERFRSKNTRRGFTVRLLGRLEPSRVEGLFSDPINRCVCKSQMRAALIRELEMPTVRMAPELHYSRGYFYA
jgi:hypothetical protein